MVHFLRVAVLGLVLSVFTVVLLGQLPQPEPYTFLRKQLAFSSTELGALEKSEILVKLPKTPETREVAVFAIMRLDVPGDFFVDKVRDIVGFKKSDNVLQIGKFSNPPRIEDLSGLTLDQVDIDALRRCRAKSCDVKVPTKFMDRLIKEVDWSAPAYRERVTTLVREMLLDHVKAYLRGGDATLGEYNDRPYDLKLADEFRALLKPAPYMYDYVPEFQRYLQDFPRAQAEDVENFIYWSKEDFGLKPVISVTHISIFKRRHASGSDVMIGSKGIYASHYFEGSLGMTGFIQSRASEPSRSYLIYVNRSHTDALRGLFAGLKRTLITGSLRDGARKNMAMIRQKLEMDYRK